MHPDRLHSLAALAEASPSSEVSDDALMDMAKRIVVAAQIADVDELRAMLKSLIGPQKAVLTRAHKLVHDKPGPARAALADIKQGLAK